MIGKKSKFQEHEQKSKVQDNKDIKASDNSTLGEGINEKGDNSSDSKDNIDISGKQNRSTDVRFTAESKYEVGEGQEEEVEEIPEEIQQVEEKCTILRPPEQDKGDSKGEGNSDVQWKANTLESSTQDGKSTTIINPIKVKSDTELLWDEICNGVKGKNSGIPMGFNRLNKYLGLRKSIYTTIGAAAG